MVLLRHIWMAIGAYYSNLKLVMLAFFYLYINNLPMINNQTERTLEDKTEKLSFNAVDDASIQALLENRIIVIKHRLSNVALDGIGTAFENARRRALPRRLVGRAIKEAGFEDTSLYRKIRVSDIAGNPNLLPKHMNTAQPAANQIVALNNEFFKQTPIVDRYGIRELNLAFLFVSRDASAFNEHQDGQGATGLGYASQTRPTKWTIHEFVPSRPAPPSFTFDTERGDVVVLMEREGACPATVPFRQGTREYFEDGSLIHSGSNPNGSVRYGMSIFHGEILETI